MRTFCSRELRAIAASRAFAAASAVHLGVLTGFLLLWGGGMPGLAGAVVYDQLRVVQGGLLAVLLPWAALRCGAPERRNELVLLAFAAATPPLRVLLGQCAGRCAAMLAVSAVGLPVAIVAHQASGLPFVRLTADLVPMSAFCGAAAVVTAWATLTARSRVGEWAAASLLLIAVWWIAPVGSVLSVVWLSVLIVVGAAVLAARAGARLRYLSEETPWP